MSSNITNHILLLNPYIYDFAAFDCWAKPKGLLETGRILQGLGFTVCLIDCLYKEDLDMAAFAEGHAKIVPSTVKNYGTGRYFQQEVDKPLNMKAMPRRMYRFGCHPDLLRRKLKSLETEPALIGVAGIMTYWCRGVRETIAIAKEVFPETPVALGGIYPTLLPDHAGKYSGADLVFRGEANRESLIELLDQAGLGQLINTDGRRKSPPIFYPYPEASYGVINLSEGCHKHCTYCASKVLRPRYRGYDLHTALEQIHFFVDRGIHDIAFYDDALLYQKEIRLLPFLETITKDFPHLRFHTPNGMHLELLDSKTADLLHAAHFKTLRFGFETVHQDLMKRTGVKLRLENFKKRIAILQDAGFSGNQIGIYVMIGLPGQTVESVVESLEFVRSCGVHANITEFSPIPGTREFENAAKNASVDFAGDPELQNNSLLPLRDPAFPFEVVNRLKNLCYQERGF